MKRYFTSLNIVFTFCLIAVILIALGIIPRWLAFFVALAYLLFIIFSSLEDSFLLFVRSIPFFIALPITSSFDNFNTWRIVLILIFLKWFFPRWKKIFNNLKSLSFKDCWNKYRVESLAFILFLFAFFSLFNAYDIFFGAKRIIYFINIALIFFIAKSLVSEREGYFKSLVKNIFLSGILVVFFAYLQLLSVFFMPIDVFHHWWGMIISLRFYGKSWSEIVMWGNTWFSYTAGSLKLRVFSVFPDSHSFPLYLLMAMPAFLAVLANKLSWGELSLTSSFFKRIKKFNSFLKGETKKNSRLIDLSIFLFLISFILIVSGTRGIWISVVFPIFFLFILSKKYSDLSILPILAVLTFILLFTIAPLFYALPQFRTEETFSNQTFAKRMMSSFDLGEKSNLGRIVIWQKTIKSLLKHPLLGVGIGNFPVVLEESIFLSKAGSSAHNLFLHIGAEMGLIALIVFLYLIFEVFKKAFQILKRLNPLNIKIFAFSFIIYLSWVLGYSLTDAALFDERAFLIFMLVLGIILGLAEKEEIFE